MSKNAIRSKVVKEFIPPIRIVAKSENVEGAEYLLSNRAVQVYAYATAEKYMCCKGKGYIILDFGTELHGGVRILSKVISTLIASVRIRFGESLGEACADIGEKNATFHHGIRDMTVEIPNLSIQEWGQTGFRFVRIDFLNEETEYRVVNIYAASTHRPLRYQGNFTCNDGLINDIYKTARRTIFLNMQDRLWEGIKRDRQVWIGDMQPEVLAITDIFGASDCVEDSIAESIENNPLPCWFGCIPTYSFWLICILYDYYLKTGKEEFVRKYIPYAEGVLAQLDACVSDDGKIDYSRVPEAVAREGYFLDWPTVNTKDAYAGNRFMFIFVIENMKKLYALLDLPVCGLCDKLLRKLRSNIETDVTAKQVVAFGHLAGCLDKTVVSQRLTVGGAKGLSTFMSYFILRSIAECSNASTAVNIMKEYYGGMLSRGATTFWEDFDVEWLENSGRIDEFTPEGKLDLHGDFGRHCYVGYRHSLCHGWSCGPVQFLTEYVLGVKVLKEGCKEIEISPNLGDLKWCKGVFPTPYGKVKISHKVVNGTVVSEIDAPKEIKIIRK